MSVGRRWVPYKTHDEKVEMVQDICQNLPSAKPGDEFDYREVTMTKLEKDMERRQHSIVMVEDPEGKQVAEVDMAGADVDELVTFLDEVRQDANMN